MAKAKPKDSVPLATAQSPESTSRPAIPSRDLFQGGQQVLIEHDGEIYRLVLTRNNKLLLQK